MEALKAQSEFRANEVKGNEERGQAYKIGGKGEEEGNRRRRGRRTAGPVQLELELITISARFFGRTLMDRLG